MNKLIISDSTWERVKEIASWEKSLRADKNVGASESEKKNDDYKKKLVLFQSAKKKLP